MVLYKVFQTTFYVKMLEAIHTDAEPQSSLCVLYPPVSSPSPSLAGPWVLCSLHTPESSCGHPPPQSTFSVSARPRGAQGDRRHMPASVSLQENPGFGSPAPGAGMDPLHPLPPPTYAETEGLLMLTPRINKTTEDRQQPH